MPTIGISVGAALWGLFWIPVRGIEAAGVDAFWTGSVVFGASLVLCLPIMLYRHRIYTEHWRSILLPGLLSGTAFALYIASLNLTDIVRAILLFYMSPMWSTLLGILILKESLTSNRVLALFLAFSGLYVVLAVDGMLPLPRNTGDLYALLSGFFWSIASVKLFQDGNNLIIEKVSLFIFFALIVSLILVLWHQGNLSQVPDSATLLQGWYWIAIIAAVMLPICYLTVWPATVLSPGRVGMLLMFEVIFGVASAAILTNEAFGLREVSGTGLLLAAAVVEVMRRQDIDKTDTV